MNRRLAAVLVALALLAAACSSGGDDEPAPQELPPTTLTTTPILPTGAADTVRRWVEAVAAGNDDVTFGLLAPQSQAAVGGLEGLAAARRDLREEWAPWAARPKAAYDALPVVEGAAAVVVHGETEGGEVEASAVVLRVAPDGDRWLVDPLESTGEYRAEPEEGATVEPEPDLAVELDDDAEVLVFVDGQKAVQQPDDGTGRVEYAPERRLAPGWHVATFVFRRGEALTARAAPYLVAED